MKNRQESKGNLNDPMLARVRARLDTYSILLHYVKSCFQTEKKEFPIAEVRQFALSLNSSFITSFFIDNDGMVDADCVESIAAQCVAHPSRSEFFEIRIQSLVRFLYQIALDNLSYEQVVKLKDFMKGLR